jgi:hypothetical protein
VFRDRRRRFLSGRGRGGNTFCRGRRYGCHHSDGGQEGDDRSDASMGRADIGRRARSTSGVDNVIISS